MKPKTVPQPFKPKPGEYQFVSKPTASPESSTILSSSTCPTCTGKPEQLETSDDDRVVFRD